MTLPGFLSGIQLYYLPVKIITEITSKYLFLYRVYTSNRFSLMLTSMSSLLKYCVDIKLNPPYFIK
jgi:hypothetical protein